MRSAYRETIPGNPLNPVIIYDQDDNDGIVVTTFPAPGYTVEQIVATDIPPNSNWFVIPTNEMPVRQIFRDAWCLYNGRIKVDNAKCRVIAKRMLKSAVQFKLQEEGLQLPDFLLTEEERARATEIVNLFREHLTRVETASTLDLYALQDEGHLPPEPEDIDLTQPDPYGA